MFEEIIRHSPQLFYFPKFSQNTPKAEPAATGVFLQVNDFHFLITAHHVFKHAPIHEFAIMAGDKLCSILGDTAFYPIPETLHDNVDLVLIKLINTDQIAFFKRHYGFLQLGNLNLLDDTPATMYALLGYPIKKSVVDGLNIMQAPFPFFTQSVKRTNIEDYGFNYEDNITVRYNRRHQRLENEEKMSMGPKDLKGMSGGGIFRIISTEPPLCALEAIMIEERTNRGLIIGTKIRLVLGLLRHFGIDI